MLRLGGLRALGGGGLALGDFAAGKTGVAFFKFGERGIRVDGGSWMVCAKDKRRETYQADERESGVNVHFSWIVMTSEKSQREHYLT
jgi:hypothetical protein